MLHLVDVSPLAVDEPVKSFDTINEELRKYNPELMERPIVAVATKTDSLDDPDRLDSFRDHCREAGIPFFAISSATHEGVGSLLDYVSSKLEELVEHATVS